MRILFVDVTCPKSYDHNTLKNEPLGGTEATVIRVAEGLAELGHDVRVSQFNRANPVRSPNNVLYSGPYGLVRNQRFDAVILLREPKNLEHMRLCFPDAKHYLWLHDLPGVELKVHSGKIERVKPTIVCVSDFHRSAVIDILKVYIDNFDCVTRRVYNPVDDELGVGRDLSYDKNKLVFFSSPHKGLFHTLTLFERLLEFNKDFKLHVANPGYLPDYGLDSAASVVNIGPVPHSRIMSEVRNSLCVFYPNIVFPETFGLVFAEANALGTPVVAHSFGAAHEVLGHYSGQVIDCRYPKGVIDKVMSWYEGNRPVVNVNPVFRLANVLQQWESILP